MLTEIYIDSSGSGHFWPHNASVYASLFAATGSAIKSALSADDRVLFAGPNVIPTNTPNKEFFSTFIENCSKLGYASCPLDLATFHFFNTDPTVVTKFTTWVHSKLAATFSSSSFPTPRMAITAWGLSSSGKFDYNSNITGAAYLAEHLVTIQSTPVEFAIFYKFDGINCDVLGYPCLVIGSSGKLKPTAMAFVLHSRLIKAATHRLAAKCYYCHGGALLAAVSNQTQTLSILMAGTNSKTVPPAQLTVHNWGATCQSAKSTLTVASVTVNADSTGALSETTVSGAFQSSGVFYAAGASAPYSLPIKVDEGSGFYSSLVTVLCGSGS